MTSAIFVGIYGDVIALDRATGQQLWKTVLKGADFVTLVLDEDRVIAATKGEIFCLDAATGHLLWRNGLPGEGRGVVTIATPSGASGATPGFREKQKQEEAANTAVIAAS